MEYGVLNKRFGQIEQRADYEHKIGIAIRAIELAVALELHLTKKRARPAQAYWQRLQLTFETKVVETGKSGLDVWYCSSHFLSRPQKYEEFIRLLYMMYSEGR